MRLCVLWYAGVVCAIFCVWVSVLVCMCVCVCICVCVGVWVWMNVCDLIVAASSSLKQASDARKSSKMSTRICTQLCACGVCVCVRVCGCVLRGHVHAWECVCVLCNYK